MNASLRERLGRTLAVLVLCVAFVAQPALAFAATGARCSGSADCCCTVERTLAKPSCCASEEHAPVEGPRFERAPCRCDVDAPEEPAPSSPALPAEASAATDLGSFADWLFVHAVDSARVACGPPEVRVPPDAADRARVPRADSRPLAARTGSWALLLRGVERLLSVLAVARA